MTIWRVRRNQGDYETQLYDTEVFSSANPFGNYQIAKIDDTSGTKFDQYRRGTRVDYYYIDSDDGTLLVESGETYTIADGETESYGLVQDNGTLQVDGTLQVTGDGQTHKATGFVVEPRELDQQGADALEVESYSFDLFLRQETVSNDQSGKTILAALEDIIKTDTPVTWVASNVTVDDNQTLTQSYQGNKVENVLQNLASKSGNEAFGVNSEIEFFFNPRESSRAPRDIDNSQWFDYDIPEVSKETINKVTVFYDDGDKSVTVSDGSDQKNLQDNLGTDDPVAQAKTVTREDITDIDDARAVANQILEGRKPTLTGEVETFGLLDAEPGDIIDVTIVPRGIDDEFQIAALKYQWGRDSTRPTIVENRGEQDQQLVRVIDSVERIENRPANQDAISNEITSTNVGVLIDVQGLVDGSTFDQFVITNQGRNKIRDGWAGDGNLDITTLAVGDGTTSATRADTSLANQLNTYSATETLNSTDGVEYTAGVSETVRELGLIDSNGDLVARGVFASDQSGTTLGIRLTVSNDSSINYGVITNDGIESVRDVIADNSPNLPSDYAYGSDATDPTVSDTSLGTQEVEVGLDEILVQSADLDSDWQDIVDISDTDPLEISGDSLQTTQTSFIREGENPDRSNDSGASSDTNYSNGSAENLSNSGAWIEYDFTLDYTIPSGQFTVFERYETSGNVEITYYLDGQQIMTNFVDTILTHEDLSTRNEWTDPGVVEAGEHTLRLEVTNDDGSFHFVDTIAPADNRYSYTLDNSVSGSDRVSGPEDYPHLEEVAFSNVQTRRDLDAATVNQTWNDTSNNQKIELSNDGGSTWDTTNNSQTASASFMSSSTQIQTRVGISRFGSDSNNTPTSGFNGQSVSLHNLFANIQAINPSDTGQVSIQAIVQPDSEVGTTFAEGGQLDSGDDLISHVTFPEFQKMSGQRIISAESVNFDNP